MLHHECVDSMHGGGHETRSTIVVRTVPSCHGAGTNRCSSIRSAPQRDGIPLPKPGRDRWKRKSEHSADRRVPDTHSSWLVLPLRFPIHTDTMRLPNRFGYRVRMHHRRIPVSQPKRDTTDHLMIDRRSVNGRYPIRQRSFGTGVRRIETRDHGMQHGVVPTGFHWGHGRAPLRRVL